MDSARAHHGRGARPAHGRARLVRACALLAAVLALVLAPSALAANGDIYSFAGDGISGLDNGPANSASFRGILGVAVAPNGDVYAADYADNKIRKISGGTVTTFAGTGAAGGSGDFGLATNATLREPSDVDVDALGNVYIADSGNNRIRVVGTNGIITTHPGTWFGGLSTPYGVAVNPAGGIYVADYGNDRIRKFTAGGSASTIAGNGTTGGGGDGGQATLAELNGPSDVAVDSAGNVLIAEYTGNRVRKVSTGGIITKLAGTGFAANAGNSVTASTAPVNRPWGVTSDGAGNVYVSEISGHVIRRISPLNVMTRIAGTAGTAGYSGNNGPAVNALLDSPGTPAMAPDGDLYFPDYGNYRVRRIQGLGPPAAPTVSATTPSSPRNQNTLTVSGTAATGSTVTLYTNSTCTSAVAASGTAATFASPGLSVTVADNSTTTFYATAANGAGSSACSTASVTYVEDEIAPSDTAITALPPARDNDLAPQWSFSGEGTFQCQLSRDGSVVSAFAACTSPKSYSVSTEGDYTFSVRATDAAGNTGAPVASATYTLDTTAPPAPTITGTPASPSPSRAPIWSWTGELNATYECRFDQGGVPVGTWFICISGAAQDLTGFADGTYNLSVRPTDQYGNVGTAATSTYTLDTTPPGQPSITVSQGTPGNDETPQWSYSGGSGTYQCRLDRTSAPATQIDGPGWTTCAANPKEYDLSAEVDGTYVFSLRTIDTAGNTSTPLTRTYVLDTAAPSDTAITASPAAVDNVLSPQWSFSGEGSFQCQLSRDGSVVSTYASCTSPKSYSVSTEGDYTFSVRATDSAANTGTPVTSATYTLDTSGPAAPTITGTPTSPSPSRAPAWSWTGELNATYECRFDQGGVPVGTWFICTSGAAQDLTGFADGTYNFVIRPTDQAGNPGTTVTRTYTLDTVPPGQPGITAHPPSPGNDETPQWAYSGGSGTYECRLDRTSAPAAQIDGPGWTTCGASPKGFDLSGEVDGTYVFSLRTIDAAGNTSAPVTSSFTLDTTVAGTPTITAVPGPVGASRNPSWQFTGDPSGTLECRLDDANGQVFGWTACTSPHGFAIAGNAADGDYTFQVRGVRLGVPGAAAGDVYTLDTTAPSPPSVSTPPPLTGNTRTPSWAYSAEAGATIECRLDRGATEIHDWTACPSPYNAALPAVEGSYTLSLRATDAAGNRNGVTPSTYVLDTTPPAEPVVDAPPSSYTRNAQPSFSFTTQAGSTYQCRLEGGNGSTAGFAPCTSPAVYDLSGQFDGLFTFQVKETDAAGNTGAPRSIVWQLDRAGADVRIDSSPGAIGKQRTVAWSFSSEPGATFQCSLVLGGAAIFGQAGCGSPNTYDLAGRADGVYTFSVWATDGAGNTGVPATHSYELDTAAPAKPDIKSTPASPGSDRSPTWTFTAEAGAALECRLELDGEPVRNWADCASPRKYDMRGLDDGTYRFLTRARDAAGNVSGRAGDNYTLDTTAPAAPTIERAPRAGDDDVSPSWRFDGEAGATFECELKRGEDTVERREACRSPKTYNLSDRRAARYTFNVRATDRAGNTGRDRSDSYELTAAAAADTPAPSAAPAPSAPTTPAPADPVPATPDAAPATPADADEPGSPSEDRPTRGDGDSKDGLAGSPGSPDGGGPTAPDAASGETAAGTGDEGENGAAKPEPKRKGAAAAAHAVTQAVGKAVEVVAKNADKSVFPFSLVMIVFAFLGIQGRIDRSDPKLALAPLHADPDLEFFPPPSEA